MQHHESPFQSFVSLKLGVAPYPAVVIVALRSGVVVVASVPAGRMPGMKPYCPVMVALRAFVAGCFCSPSGAVWPGLSVGGDVTGNLPYGRTAGGTTPGENTGVVPDRVGS